jgi:hypothetical protein
MYLEYEWVLFFSPPFTTSLRAVERKIKRMTKTPGVKSSQWPPNNSYYNYFTIRYIEFNCPWQLQAQPISVSATFFYLFYLLCATTYKPVGFVTRTYIGVNGRAWEILGPRDWLVVSWIDRGWRWETTSFVCARRSPYTHWFHVSNIWTV